MQERLPHSGLLQSSLVTLYTVYLTWSAVANNPGRKMNPEPDMYISFGCFESTEKECNPGMFGMMEGFGNATTTAAPPTHTTRVTFDTTNIIGLVVWLLCILYNCISSAVEVSKISHDNSEKRGRCSVSIRRTPFAFPAITTFPQFASRIHSIALPSLFIFLAVQKRKTQANTGY